MSHSAEWRDCATPPRQHYGAMPTQPTLRAQIAAILDAEARAIADLASGERATHTLAGTITAAHNRFVAATAAQHALRTVCLRGSDASTLSARTASELTQALDVLTAVRVTIACVNGAGAAAVVATMLAATGKLLESELSPAVLD